MTGYMKNQKGVADKGFQSTLIDHLGGFLIIGCITTFTDISLLWVFTDLCGIWYLVSAGISYCISALLSFVLNKSFNFKNVSQNYVKQASAFFIIATSSLILNLLIISICVEIWSVNYLVAKGIATGVAFLWNYFGQSAVTFRIWT
jgi:putative flippase GtrA